MQELIMTLGLPGSGKSTWAKQYVNDHPEAMRINKDDLREMLHAKKFSRKNEEYVIEYRNTLADLGLSAGRTVIIDDTNFSPKHKQKLSEIANQHGVPLVVVSFTHVPLEQCIKNDLKRDKSVGKDVILEMHKRYIKRNAPKVEWDPALDNCIICDLDGTLCLFGNENPYDRDFLKDQAAPGVLTVLTWKKFAEHATGDKFSPAKLILFSGRSAKFKDQTEEWLKKNGIFHDELHMRAEEDVRKDSVVKQEMYEAYVKGKYNVLFILDDRNQVVDLWRSLGLTCFQVAEGDF